MSTWDRVSGIKTLAVEQQNYPSTSAIGKQYLFIIFASKTPLTMENELKRIYSGSVVNAEFIGSVLEQNDIQFLIRNFQEESLVAGWAASTIKGDASVFVFDKDYDRAMLLLDEIDESEIEEEE